MAKKIDSTKNSEGLHEKIKAMPQKKMYSLRINHMTTIFVPKEKCTEEYRQQYLQKMGLSSPQVRPADHETCDNKIDKEELQRMFSSNRTIKDMAKRFDVATTTIQRYIKANNMIR